MRSRALLAAAIVGFAVSGCALEENTLGGDQQYLHVQAAGQRGMDYLVNATVNWQDTHEPCFACHTQGMSMWGASIGVQRGYTVDPAQLSQIVDRVENTQQPDGLWAHSGSGNVSPRFTTAFAASGLAFYDRYVATDAQATFMEAVEWLRSQQAADGSWPSDSVWTAARSEIFRAHEVFVTMGSVIAMSRAFDLTLLPAYESARDRGVAWLRTASDSSTQGLSFKLIGLLEGGTPTSDPDVVATRNRLLSYQNADGGFGVGPSSTSTPYHTGQAIYTLRLAGMALSQPAIAQGIQWLLDHQNADGSWPIGATHLDATDPVAPSMWPVIALGELGELGVELTANPTEIQILAEHPGTQIVEYTITVTNRGTSADTYDLDVTGDLGLFSAALSATEISLPAGASGQVTLGVLAPADLPHGLPVLHTVTAVSQTNPIVTGSVTVKTFTPPDAPVTGHPTMTELIDGFGITIRKGDQVRIAARVTDLELGTIVSGGGMGVVHFSVAGLVVGSDDDSDGDGVFEITWRPGADWPHLGAQSVMASYSGIDRDEPLYDLLPSFDVEGVTITLPPDSPCGNTGILIGDALAILRGIDINLPPGTPQDISNKIRVIIGKLEDVLARMNAGDCRGAQNKLNAVFGQLESAIAQIEGHSCANKPGNQCIDDDLAAILISELRAVWELLDRAMTCILDPDNDICP